MKRILRRPFHPIILAIYPVIYLYSQNTDQTPFSTVIGPFFLAIIGASLLWLGLYFLYKRDLTRAALLASLIAILFLSYGHGHSALHLAYIDAVADLRSRPAGDLGMKRQIHITMLVVWAGILGLVIWRLRKTAAETLAKISWALNAMTAVLLVMPLSAMIITLALATAAGPSEAGQQMSSAEETTAGLARELGYKPDIYEIVVDGYARQDVLAEYFDFENTEFLDWIRGQGFVVPPESRVNYNWTYLSFASYLNLRYINDVFEGLGKKSRNRTRAYRMTRDNEVMHFLRRRGYRYVHLNSTWGATMMNMYADQEIACDSSIFDKEFYRVLVESTMLKVWESSVGLSLTDCHLSNFATLEKIGPALGPKFVFAHFVPPHHPYLFDREGNILRDATVSNQFDFQKKLWGFGPMYVDQLVYVNQRLKGIIEKLLSTSPHPPIIIINSDHGPWLLNDTNEKDEDYLHGRFANFMALHLPGARGDEIPDDMAVVNLFRHIFNLYFGAELEILESKYYASPYKRPYDFSEVIFDEQSPTGRLVTSDSH